MPLISVLPPYAVADEVPHGRGAAGGLEEKGDGGFLQADEARAGHVSRGPEEKGKGA